MSGNRRYHRGPPVFAIALLLVLLACLHNLRACYTERMIPIEIFILKRRSPALQRALQSDRDAVWRLLSDHVQSRFGYFPQGAHHCERCDKITYPTLKSPYNNFHPGWCIDCVLAAFLSHEQQIDQDFVPRLTCSWMVQYHVYWGGH